MQLLQPRKIHRQYVFSDELVVRIQRFKEYFPWGGALPPPSTKVIAVWNDLPNVTMDNLSVTMKTELVSELVLLQAPPPTPTGLAFGTNNPASRDPSLNDIHDDDSWLVVSDTISVAQTLDSSSASEDDLASQCSYSGQSLDRQSNEDPVQTSDSNSSDQDSLSSSSGGPQTPVGFDNMVSQWLLDYRARGMDAFIESLIAFGVTSTGTTLQASHIARAIIRKVTKVSYTEGRSLECAIRFSVLAAFKRCWGPNDTSTDVSSTQTYATPSSPYGINVASFVGSLFDEKISSAKDVHLCLALLLEGEKRFDRLCAMHALLVQANDKLCKNRNLPALMQFKDGITCIGEKAGESLWATTPRSKAILTDILGLIDRWIVSQAIKREKSRMAAGTGHRTIRHSAVGPRLRG